MIFLHLSYFHQLIFEDLISFFFFGLFFHYFVKTIKKITDLLKIENERELELKRIIAITNDKMREKEIQELIEKLNYQSKAEELKCLFQRYKDMHEEQMLKIQYQHDENKMKLYNDNLKDFIMRKNLKMKKLQWIIIIKKKRKMLKEYLNKTKIERKRISRLKWKNELRTVRLNYKNKIFLKNY